MPIIWTFSRSKTTSKPLHITDAFDRWRQRISVFSFYHRKFSMSKLAESALRKTRYARSQRLAYHEAGHAVVAHCLGHRINYVSTYPGKNGRQAALSKTRTDRIDEEIMIYLAGQLADCLLRGKRSYSMGDVLGSGSLNDMIQVDGLAQGRDTGASDIERRTYIQWLKLRTRRLLMLHWSSVEVLAGQLIGRKKLSGAAAAEIMGRMPA